MSDEIIKKLTFSSEQTRITKLVNSNGFALLIALAKHSNDEGVISISNESLMEILGFESLSSLKRVRDKCIESKLLKYTKGNKNDSGVYVIPYE